MEPTLNDIERPATDPYLGGEEPSVLNDSSETLKLINQNAQFKAQNDWKRYQQFLGDYENRVKNINDISALQISDSDRPYFKQRTVDLLKGALKDPYAIYSPEFNQKLSSLTQDATSSKMKADYDKANRLFLAQHPEWITDENKAMVTDLIQNQTLDKGGWKPYMLQPPADTMDRMAYFNKIKMADPVMEKVNANRVDEKAGVTYERQDTKYKRDKFIDQIKLGYDGDPRIRKIAQADFNALPQDVKSNFEDAKDYWVNFGAKHFGSYDDITEQGKEVIQGLPNFLDREKLNLGWYNAATSREIANKKPEGGGRQTQPNTDETNIIYGVNGEKKLGDGKGSLIFSNGVLKNDKGQDLNYTGEMFLPLDFFSDDILNEYRKYTGGTKVDKDGNPIIETTAGFYEPKADKKDKNSPTLRKVKMVNGVIDGIMTNKGTWFSTEQGKAITETNENKGYKKGGNRVIIGEQKGATQNNSVGESEKDRLRKLYGIK